MDNPINLFFSCDDNYIPFLGVTLASLKENRDPSRRYAVRILHTGLNPGYRTRLENRFGAPDFKIAFYDITQTVGQLARQLHTRDYFSKSTYYRLFIPQLFPELDKGLYLDSDLVVRGDISRLYDTELGDNLVGAVPDGIIGTIDELRLYALNRLRLESSQYFNAGVLLMNLKAMRESGFQQMFLELLQAVTFQVAQDQDYLNVICKGKALLLGHEWNTMPTGFPVEDPMLIHYNLDSKPWHRDDVRYGALFWHYVPSSGFESQIRRIRAGYSRQDTARSAQETVNLIAMGRRQALEQAENRRIHRQIDRVVGA